MKPWPVKSDYWNAGPPEYQIEYWSDIRERDYEHARAEAAIERLRVAVTALNDLYPALALDLRYAPADEDREPFVSRVETIEKALEQIGDVT